MGSSIGQIITSGGWVMWPLVIFSVLSWAIIFERAYTYLTLRPKLNRLGESILQNLRSGNLETAKQICHSQTPQIAEIFSSILDTKHPREFAERLTERNRVRLVSRFKKNLWILGTIGSASPFIGLLGTVVGIVQAFNDMAVKGAGGFSVVAAGISQALIATAAGLVVAIIALLAYNMFVNAANQTVSGIKLALDELMDYSFVAKAKSA